MRLIYLCERKGLPTLDDQRAALAAAGITAEELAEAYIDRVRRKPRPGEPAQPERDHIVGAARENDEVWVARLAVIATTRDDALRFTAAICDQGAVLCAAADGRRYRVRSEAAQDVADALRLAADIAADERAAALEKARRGRKPGKTGGRPEHDKAKLEMWKLLWFDHSISEAEFVARSGVPGKTMRNHFGKRGTPAFGAALNKRRGK